MKQCLACQAAYESTDRACPHCGATPAVIDGFDSYAPDLAHYGGGFEASHFAELARLEDGNFWFRARNRLILWALKTYAPGFKSFLEVGCGTGFVLSGVAARFPDATLMGSDIFTEGLTFAAGRLPSVQLIQMDARQIPFVAEFDAIGAFDVIEHIEEDTQVLAQIRKALRPEGHIILTVPQHRWLWSAIDDHACHRRRYSAAEIAGKLATAGFHVVRTTSFVTSLLPAMMLSRMLPKRSGAEFDPITELKVTPLMNTMFEEILNLEIAGIAWGMSYPAGGSRLVVAKRV